MFNWKNITLMVLMLSSNCFALSTTDLSQGVTPTALIAELVDTANSSVTFSNIQHKGANSAFGIFSDGLTDGLGIDRGIILSSGRVFDAIGPNKCYKTTTVHEQPGDESLNALGADTFDAAVLEFDFTPKGDSLEFNYVFASEEYIEWTGSKFNDVFGFFLNGQNIALIPDTTTPVAINSIHKTPWSEANPDFYQDNNYPFPWTIKEYNETACIAGTKTPFKTEFDGFTTVLTASATVVPGQVYHLKLVVADRGDYSLDSAVFIQGKSFTTVKKTPVKNCKMYGMHDELLNDSQLFIVDDTTQAVTVGPQHLGYDLEGLDAKPIVNLVYAGTGKDSMFGPGVLYKVDLSTGLLTSLGNVQLEDNSQIKDISGLSFNPNTSMLWGWAQGQGLFRLDVDNQSKAQLQWRSKINVEDLSWNLAGTALYLAQQHKILRYDGTDVKQFCALSNRNAKIEALETTDDGSLLLAMDGDDVVYTLDLAQSNENSKCIIAPATNIPATSYKDIEGMAWVCTIE